MSSSWVQSRSLLLLSPQLRFIFPPLSARQQIVREQIGKLNPPPAVMNSLSRFTANKRHYTTNVVTGAFPPPPTPRPDKGTWDLTVGQHPRRGGAMADAALGRIQATNYSALVGAGYIPVKVLQADGRIEIAWLTCGQMREHVEAGRLARLPRHLQESYAPTYSNYGVFPGSATAEQQVVATESTTDAPGESATAPLVRHVNPFKKNRHDRLIYLIFCVGCETALQASFDAMPIHPLASLARGSATANQQAFHEPPGPAAASRLAPGSACCDEQLVPTVCASCRGHGMRDFPGGTEPPRAISMRVIKELRYVFCGCSEGEVRSCNAVDMKLIEKGRVVYSALARQQDTLRGLKWFTLRGKWAGRMDSIEGAETSLAGVLEWLLPRSARLWD